MIKNISLLSFDKISRLFIGLIVSLLMAKFFGPEKLGMWNYTFSIISMLTSIAIFSGIDTYIIFLLSKYKFSYEKVLSSMFIVRLLFSTISYSIILLIVFFFDIHETVKSIMLIYGIVFFIQSLNILDYFNQSTLLFKYNVIAFNLSFYISSIIKIYIIMNNLELTTLVEVLIIENILYSLLLVYFFKKNYVFRYKPSLLLVKKIIIKGYPLLFSSLVIIAYSRINALIIEKYLDFASVGYFYLTFMMIESLLGLVYILHNVKYPKIITANDHIIQIQLLIKQSIFVFIGLYLLCWVFLLLVINYFLGNAYSTILELFPYFMPVAFLMLLNFLLAQYVYVIENKTKELFKRNFIGIVINVLLSLIFIEQFNLQGVILAMSFGHLIMIVFTFLYEEKAKKLLYKGIF